MKTKNLSLKTEFKNEIKIFYWVIVIATAIISSEMIPSHKTISPGIQSKKPLSLVITPSFFHKTKQGEEVNTGESLKITLKDLYK